MTDSRRDHQAGLDDARLTNEFATRVMGWKPGPGRFIRPHRGWLSRSRFQPFSDIKDAFRVLDAVTNDYSVIAIPGRGFQAEVRVKGRVGRANGDECARTISMAVAMAIGIVRCEG